MNKKKLIFNIFFTIILISFWSVILFATFLLYIISDIFVGFGNGMLIYAFMLIYTLSIILPIIFRKKLLKYMPLHLWLIVSAIFSVIIVSTVFFGARSYISSFSQEKWNNNETLRYYMVEDLEKKHQITGKTKNEITKLIGKPTYTYDNYGLVYEYRVGFNLIDEVVYQIEFENNIAKKTTIVQH